MDIEKIEIYPTNGLCMTVPKSVPALNRAIQWVKEKVLKQKYHAYYDFSHFNRHKIGTYTSLEKAVQARNHFEINLVHSKGVRGILLEMAKG